MSATALLQVWGAEDAHAIAREVGRIFQTRPRIERYCGSSYGVWSITTASAVVSIYATDGSRTEEPPFWIDVYAPSSSAEQRTAATLMFERLRDTTTWRLVLDVEGEPERARLS